MDKQIVSEVRSRWKDVLQHITSAAETKVNGQTSYICPICGHGAGGDGLTFNPRSKDGNGLHCFGCGFSGDIIDLIGQTSHADFVNSLKCAAGYLGIYVPDEPYKPKVEEMFPPDNPTAAVKGNDKGTEKPKTDFTAFFLQAKSDNAGEYLKGRGISKEVQDRFGVGYVEKWKHPKSPSFAPEYPVVIFPKNKGAYTARYTMGAAEIKDLKERKEITSKSPQVNETGEKAPFFCEKLALSETAPIFVVEGETDALSIWELGYPAIALGSTSQAAAFAEFAIVHKDKMWIVGLDTDTAGKNAIKTIEEKLNGTAVKYIVADINGRYHDPNDRLVNDGSGLLKALKISSLQISDPEGYERELLQKNNAAAQINDFWNQIYASKENKPIESGFLKFDDVLDGGITPEQLIFIGAVSSLGKTTFLLQMMDNIAASGNPVMLFSLEMSRNEIMSKSISRYTFTEAIKQNIKTSNAKTARGITAGYKHDTYSKTEIDLMNTASKAYAETAAKNVYIYEGNGDTSVREVSETVSRFVKLTGQKPVVFIDYLQILAPYDVRMTDKQNVDVAVKILKQLARDEGITVIAISSLNRENYNEPISMTAFKESGAIEYSSDVLIGLQFRDVETVDENGKRKKNKDFDVNKAKEENPRRVDMKVLKNRNGKITSEPLHFLFYPAFNLYQETT